MKNKDDILVTAATDEHEKGIQYYSKYHGAEADQRSPGCSIRPAANIGEQQKSDCPEYSKYNAEYKKNVD